MNMNELAGSLVAAFEHDFMRSAALACLIIGFTNGFLGVFLVLRQMALAADALSHSLLPGMALAAMVFGLSAAGLFAGGLVAALLVALCSQLISGVSRLKQETAVAALYVMAFATGVALLQFAEVRVSLKHFLFGDLLGISSSDLWVAYAVGAVAVTLVTLFSRPLMLAIFEPSVAKTQGVPVAVMNGGILVLVVLAMIASLQAVGVLLALGLLILPASTVYLLTDRFAILPWASGLLGALGSIVGLVVSFLTGLPSGPAIIIVLGMVFFFALIGSPRYGVLASHLGRRHFHEESLEKWN